jgi:hypothetical protein
VERERRHTIVVEELGEPLVYYELGLVCFGPDEPRIRVELGETGVHRCVVLVGVV